MKDTLSSDPVVVAVKRSEGGWPGAFEYEIRVGDQTKYLSVDCDQKLRWYLEKLKTDPNWPCGVDYG